jgi:hypothetical protein
LDHTTLNTPYDFCWQHVTFSVVEVPENNSYTMELAATADKHFFYKSKLLTQDSADPSCKTP